MLLHHAVRINYILNMENNKDYSNEILAVKEATEQKKICKCCGKELPISNFKRQSRGYRKICMACERSANGVSERFSSFTDRELMEELRSRGYKGIFKKVQIIEVKL